MLDILPSLRLHGEQRIKKTESVIKQTPFCVYKSVKLLFIAYIKTLL